MKTTSFLNMKRAMLGSVLFFILSFSFLHPCSAQVAINNTAASPNASAILDLNAGNAGVNKGFIAPRVALIDVALAAPVISPDTGLIVYSVTAPNNGNGAGYYYWNDSAWTSINATSSGTWSLRGNAGTNPVRNFIGTTDANAFEIKVNNQKSGYIDYNGNAANTSFGYLSMNSITNGDENSAFGYQALDSNTSGFSNTAIGEGALVSNKTGSNNTANGFQALYSNSTGIYNTATGGNALHFNTTGYFNTATGYEALLQNTTGIRNTANGFCALLNTSTGIANTASGFYALVANTTASSNTAMGSYALYKNTASYNTATGDSALYNNMSGGNNTAMGYAALASATSASFNTATGYEALEYTTVGAYNTANGGYALYYNVNGNYNTALGYDALESNQSGSNNTAIGYDAIDDNITGSNNTAIGYYALLADRNGGDNSATGEGALFQNTTGNNNTANGYDALADNTTGSNNTALGFSANVASGALTNITVIGYNATAAISNSVVVGNSSVTTIGGYANWSNLSDSRFKNNVQQNVHGLDFIMKLKPVTYNLDVRKLNTFLGVTDKDETSIDKKASIIYSGFLAQDVEQAANEANYNFSGVIKPENEKDHYKMSYADFVVPLVKAVQEQQAQIDLLKAQNAELLKRIEALEKTK